MSDKSEPRFHLPFSVFDSHFHPFHMLRKDKGALALVDRALASGLVGAVEVAVDEEDFEERLAFVSSRPAIRMSAGIHPSSTHPDNGGLDARMEVIARQAGHPLVKAIGETGLDFFRDHSPREVQEDAFRRHLELAASTGLPVIIHNRNADRYVLEAVRESRCRHGVFHCFSSDAETARSALDLGFHISFAGNITYKGTEDIRAAAALVPDDRLLVETDSPYLAPQNVRGRMNHPGHLGFTVEMIASLRGTAPEAIAERTVENAVRLFPA